MKKIIALLFPLLVFSSIVMHGSPSYTYDEARPFVRWWWNGDKVEAEELVRELHLLHDQGIGGVEINPIEFPANRDPLGIKALKWLSDEWIDMLRTVFDEAEALGMQCDLIVGSGWPFGSESLPMEDRAQVMLTWCEKLEGDTHFEISKNDIYKAVDPGVTVPNRDRSFSTVCVKLVPDPIDDLSQVLDLTDRCPGDTVSVDVPPGRHCLYVMVNVKSFACVINGAPGAAGSILNHLDSAAVRRYLDHMSDTIESRLGPVRNHLRAFFADSMELEGCNWTGDFAEEFHRRRGYDILPWLPFTMFKVGRLGEVVDYNFGADKSARFNEQVCRARFDFELTKAELYHERYTATFLEWCRDKGVKSRAQAYGRGFFPLESSLGYDIPEGESWTTNWLKHKLGEEMGDDDYRRGRGYTMINKYVSSAANLTGKREVSSEEMTNTYRVFTTTPELLKIGSDMGAFSGTTHSIWSGFNYSPPRAEFPGWVQYGSFYNERCPWWPYWRLLNEYRTRISHLLMNADMITDIALLPANHDLWRDLGCQTDPFPWYLNVPYTSLIWEAIHKNGGGADYVSETILRECTINNGEMCWGSKKYGTLFLVEVTSLSEGCAEKIAGFVRSGGRVFCIGKVPEKSTGLLDFERRDTYVKKVVEGLMSEFPDRFILLEKPTDGHYLEWYSDIMYKYSLPHSADISNPDRFLLQNHYRTDSGTDFFLLSNVNLSESRETDLSIPSSLVQGRKIWIMDTDTGVRYSAPVRKKTGAAVIHLRLGPAETIVLGIGGERTSGKWKPLPSGSPDDVTVAAPWHMVLNHPEKGTIQEYDIDQPEDLKDRSEFFDFMGTIIYSTVLHLDGKIPSYINLGKVYDICELKVNGHDCGVRWYGERIFDVSGLLKKGDNAIEVKVTTVPGNYVRTLTHSYPVRRFMSGAKKEQPRSSMGLVGPVTVY